MAAAEESGKTPGRLASDTETTEKGLPRNPRIKFHFKREEFDFFFQWLAGMQSHGGVSIGEAYYAASRIREGDIESWEREWTELARRVEKRAEASEASGHRVSARESLLRAYTYYRAPLAFISPLAEPDRYRSTYEYARERFRRATSYFDVPIEAVEIPFRDATLPGYFLKPDAADVRRKTLLMIGGGDTFAEDLYYYLGPAALNRSYNYIFVDLPGQGLLPFQGLVWPERAEEPVGAVLDYLCDRPDVDTDRVAIFGLSGGGHLAPRAATGENRIKACIACALILDFSAVWNRRFVELNRKAQRSLPYRLFKSYFAWKRRAYFNMVDTYVWRFGLHSAADLINATRNYTVDPSKISCAFLNIVAQQEYEQSSGMMIAAHEAQRHVSHQTNDLVVMQADEGADSHGIGTNLGLLSQVTFDWLDTALQ